MAAKSLKPADFVHLHNHSHYSLLDGLQKVPAMLDKAKDLGMKAIALTDHGSLSGAIEFYQQAKKRDLNPIIGIETYVAARAHTDKDPQKDRQRFHLILLAIDQTGYQNLMKLSSIANLDGFYHKPRIDHKLLEKYNQGLIALSGCMAGELGHYLTSDQDKKAKQTAQWYQQLFGDRYYIEIQDHSHKSEVQAKLNDQLLKLADELKIKAVVTADAHYLNPEDQEAHEVLLCVQTGSFLDETNRMSLKDYDIYLSDPKQIIKRWGAKRPDLITNTAEIAKRCQLEIEFGRILLPSFPTPKGLSQPDYLRQLVYQGLSKRYGDGKAKTEAAAKKSLAKAVVERAEYELKVINAEDFSGYFLVVWDFCLWGKQQGIFFGPGRGSAAGSIVSYGLDITTIDPLKYGLLFERFLNPDRISMPDIDIDIQDNRRDEVINYVTEKYGQDRVANIVTFGTMAARNALRDVARVLRLPFTEAMRLAKLVPPPVQGRHTPLATTLKNNSVLKAEYQQGSAEVKRVFDMATILEGTIRNHGVHAAGVVIAPDELVKFTPLEMSQKGVVATQYSMNPIEDLGLLKMDFLGLSNLTTIKNALRIIKKVYGKDIDIDKLTLQDKPTYKLLAAGDTTGIFQLESDGMKQYLRRLKPTNFEEVAAMTALYRPGPLKAGLVDSYINRKHGQEDIKVAHPAFAPALQPTYGTLVYQEQVMRISREVCGFSGGQADTLRKAIGKKIREVMNQLEKDFIDGGVEHSKVPRKIMEKTWQDIVGFADYAFNKSHSICYGLIAYQTAYLKANYLPAFMAALMTSDSGDLDRLSVEIAECKHNGLEVLPPDINESFHEFAVVKQDNQPTKIRFAMDAIKNVGHGLVAEVIAARDKDGHFKDLPDFLIRVKAGLLNRKAWESLIKAGVFDKFASRYSLLDSLDQIVSYSAGLQKAASSGQTDLFGTQDGNQHQPSWLKNLKPAETTPPNEYLNWERQLLGLYLSQHPLQAYQGYFDQHQQISQLSADNQAEVELVAMVKVIRTVTTKKGQAMAFVTVEDLSDELDLVVFPDTYSATVDVWQPDAILQLKGKTQAANDDSDNLQLIVNQATEVDPQALATKPAVENSPQPVKQPSPAALDPKPTKQPQAAPKKPDRLWLRLLNSDDTAKLEAIKTALDEHPGQTEVVLVLGADSNKQLLRLPQRVATNPKLVKRLKTTVGASNVKT